MLNIDRQMFNSMLDLNCFLYFFRGVVINTGTFECKIIC
jgi:hypothetical protein